jgi:hypothetical protein
MNRIALWFLRLLFAVIPLIAAVRIILATGYLDWPTTLWLAASFLVAALVYSIIYAFFLVKFEYFNHATLSAPVFFGLGRYVVCRPGEFVLIHRLGDSDHTVVIASESSTEAFFLFPFLGDQVCLRAPQSPQLMPLKFANTNLGYGVLVDVAVSVRWSVRDVEALWRGIVSRDAATVLLGAGHRDSTLQDTTISRLVHDELSTSISSFVRRPVPTELLGKLFSERANSVRNAVMKLDDLLEAHIERHLASLIGTPITLGGVEIEGVTVTDCDLIESLRSKRTRTLEAIEECARKGLEGEAAAEEIRQRIAVLGHNPVIVETILKSLGGRLGVESKDSTAIGSIEHIVTAALPKLADHGALERASADVIDMQKPISRPSEGG